MVEPRLGGGPEKEDFMDAGSDRPGHAPEEGCLVGPRWGQLVRALGELSDSGPWVGLDSNRVSFSGPTVESGER